MCILYILEGNCVKENSPYFNTLLLYNSSQFTETGSVVIPGGSHNSHVSETGGFSILPRGSLLNNWLKVNRDCNPGRLRSDLVFFPALFSGYLHAEIWISEKYFDDPRF